LQAVYIVNQSLSYVPKLATGCCVCSDITITRHIALYGKLVGFR